MYLLLQYAMYNLCVEIHTTPSAVADVFASAVDSLSARTTTVGPPTSRAFVRPTTHGQAPFSPRSRPPGVLAKVFAVISILMGSCEFAPRDIRERMAHPSRSQNPSPQLGQVHRRHRVLLRLLQLANPWIARRMAQGPLDLVRSYQFVLYRDLGVSVLPFSFAEMDAHSPELFSQDIIMDWSLLRLNSKNWMLRPELGFKEESWIYYRSSRFLRRRSGYLAEAASHDSRDGSRHPPPIFVGLVLGSWIALGPCAKLRSRRNGSRTSNNVEWLPARRSSSPTPRGPFLTPHAPTSVESEHIGNVDGYRVTRNIPLPYVMPGTNVDPQHGLEEELEADSSTRKSRFFRFWHELHDGVVKDFSPLSNIATGISLPSIRGLGSPSLGTAGTEYDRRKPLGGKKKLDSSSGGSEDDGEDEDEVEHLGGPVGGVGEAWRRATELNRAEGVMDAAALGELSVGDGDLGEQHLGTSR